MVRLIDNWKAKLLAKLFTIYLRYLIGFAFVFASIVKIKGERFTTIPVTEPVGYFFEAMYQTGFYWRFLGWAQMVPALLLVSQRFASLGALLFLPVILNIFLITWSINFGSGTPVITALMFLATVYLIIWDYRKWQILFLRDHEIRLDLTTVGKDRLMSDPLWGLAGVAIALMTALPQFFESGRTITMSLIVAIPVVCLLALMLGLFRHYRRRRIDPTGSGSAALAD